MRPPLLVLLHFFPLPLCYISLQPLVLCLIFHNPGDETPVYSVITDCDVHESDNDDDDDVADVHVTRYMYTLCIFVSLSRVSFNYVSTL